MTVGLTHLLATPFIFRRIFAPFHNITFSKSFFFLISGSLICAFSQNNLYFLIAGSLIGSTGANIIESLSGFFCKKNYDEKKNISLFKGNVTLGYRTGATLTKTLFLIAAQTYGWSFCFVLSSVFFTMCYLFLTKAAKNTIAKPTREKAVLKNLLKEKSKALPVFVSFLFLLPNYIYESMITPFARQQAFSWTSIALAKGIFGTAGAFIGAQLAIWISKSKLSSRYIKALLTWNAFCHIAPIVFCLSSASSLYLLYFFANTNHACMTGLFLIFSVFLSQNYKEYDFFMSLSYVSFAVGGCIGGIIASQINLPFVFVLTSLLSLTLLKTNIFHFNKKP